jgi:hypothetical protein
MIDGEESKTSGSKYDKDDDDMEREREREKRKKLIIN